MASTPQHPTGTTGTTGTAGAVGSSGRLRPGELRRLVAERLAADPGVDVSPGELARALGRSAGAVGNALVTLVGAGHAVQVLAAPLRYRATPTTPTAAAASTPATPATAPAAPGGTRALTAAALGGPAAGSGRGGAARAGSGATTAGRGARRGRAARTAGSGGAGPVPDADAVVTGPVVRPNGQDYHPRMVAGMADVTALRKLRAAGVPALLYGPPGTGKTSVVEAAFADLITVPGDGDTTVADLVGEYTQTPDRRYVFVHGPLVRAMREGRPLFVDDATLIPPSVLAALYPAMDGRRQLVVKANGGEVIDAAPGFYVVAGHNPGVHGAVLSDALSSRFSAQIRVSTDYDLAAQLRVDRRAVRAARNLATRQERGEVGWAPQLRELIAFARIAEVLGIEAAAGNLIGVAPEEDRDTVAAVVRDAFGAAHAPLALGARITSTAPTTPTTSAAGTAPDPRAPETAPASGTGHTPTGAAPPRGSGTPYATPDADPARRTA